MQPVPVGQPLPRLSLPSVQTIIQGGSLISETGARINPSMEPIGQIDIGIPLTISNNAQPEIQGSTTPTFSASRHLPTNLREAWGSLELFTGQRSGSNNQAYSITELKQIAKNFNLQTSGNKVDLANRLRDYIIAFNTGQ